MESSNIILCELKGSVNSNPEILFSYPGLEITETQSKNIIPKFLPFGSKKGDYIITNFGRAKILSYVFNIKHLDERDDLLSISVVIENKGNPEFIKPILKEIVDKLESNNLLTEEILKDNLSVMFQGIYEESEIIIEGLSINLKEKFKEVKSTFIKSKPKLKGSFY